MVLLGSSRIRRTRGRSEPCSARARLIGDGGGALQQEWQDRRKAGLDAARQDVQVPTRDEVLLGTEHTPPLTLAFLLGWGQFLLGAHGTQHVLAFLQGSLSSVNLTRGLCRNGTLKNQLSRVTNVSSQQHSKVLFGPNRHSQ